MLQPLSRAEKLLRELFLDTAKGESFERLASYYGFRKPRYISEEAWRLGIKKALYGARGTPMMCLSFLEAIFSEWIRETSTYDALVVSPNIVEFDGVSCNHEGRYVRINGVMHRSSYVREAPNDNQLVLQPMDTMMFTGAKLNTLETVKLEFLPFDIEEYGCEYRILLDKGVLGMPKYYFPNKDGVARSAGELPNGHIMQLFSTVIEERFGSQIEGPYPIYLSADEFASLFFDALDMMLAAGVRESVLMTQWCPDEASIYGSLFNKKVYGVVTVDPPALITPTRS
jgi:hypothetical protein